MQPILKIGFRLTPSYLLSRQEYLTSLPVYVVTVSMCTNLLIKDPMISLLVIALNSIYICKIFRVTKLGSCGGAPGLVRAGTYFSKTLKSEGRGSTARYA